MAASIGGKRSQPGGGPDEPTMFLQRPSSASKQDVGHVLARSFRDRFTRDTIPPATIELLKTSREGTDDAYHQHYVDSLIKVQEERDRRMAEAAMLERHIMQAQAAAIAAEEREANRKSPGGDLGPCADAVKASLPSGPAHFRSCIDSGLLRRFNLIAPEDFTRMSWGPVPPPAGSDIPHHAQPVKGKDGSGKSPRQPCDGAQKSNDICCPPPADPVTKVDIGLRSHSSVAEAYLWKKQIGPAQRETLRAELSTLQAPVDHLKAPRHAPVGSKVQERTSLVRIQKRKPMEPSIRPTPLDDKCLGVQEPPPVLLSIPSVVTFTDFKVGQVYEMTVEIKNVTTVLRPVRVIPPKTSHFSVCLGQFPSEQGLIASGMSCYYTIQFSPDSLSDFDDVLTVHTQSVSPLCVPLRGRRPPPILTLSSCLNVGDCLVGGMKMAQFTGKNTGGEGRFCLIPSADWPTANYKSSTAYSPSEGGGLQLGSFEIHPTRFELRSGESVTLEVMFAPTAVVSYSESVTMVCDNCHVTQITVTGEGVTAHVELACVEGGVSELALGELGDVTAQQLVRFGAVNPRSYAQKKLIVRNHCNVEIPYCWIIVKPHVVAPDPFGEDPPPIPTDRVHDLETAFSLEPLQGRLPPAGCADFNCIFAPSAPGEYHSSLHMVICTYVSDSVQSLTNELGPDEKWAVKVLPPINRTPQVTQITALEIEVKAECVPYNVCLVPCFFHIPGEIPTKTIIRKTFKMVNHSLSSVSFAWPEHHSSHFIRIEPLTGGLCPNAEVQCELMLSSETPGLIDECVACQLGQTEDRLFLRISAEFKGPDVIIEQADVDFGVVRVGDTGMSSVTLVNMSRDVATWSISELMPHGVISGPSEFEFSPQSGVLSPLGITSVEARFCPKLPRTVDTLFQLWVKSGAAKVVAARAEAQCPAACLLSCRLNVDDAFLGMPVPQKVFVVNQTMLPTKFTWGKATNSESSACELEFEPNSAVLQPKQMFEVKLHFTGNCLGEMADVVPCAIEGVQVPLLLAICAKVHGLSLSYSLSDEPNGFRQTENLHMVFPEPCCVGDIPRRYLFIKNNSSIRAAFNVSITCYTAPRPPTPPAKEKLLGSQRKAILSKTTNLADPNPRTAAQTHSDLCRLMLRDGRGATFDVQPPMGLLHAFEEVCVEVLGYSDTWGVYCDQLVCQVENEQPVCIPVKMTVVGSPVYFQFVNPCADQQAILRFGDCLCGTEPVIRPAQIVNTSSVDVRLDWSVYGPSDDPRKLVDPVFVFGGAFPLLDPQGEEVTRGPEGAPVGDAALNFDLLERPRVIRLLLKSNEGKVVRKPFKICPTQIVIPAHSIEKIVTKFDPSSSCGGDEEEETEGTARSGNYASFALGFISITDKDRAVPCYLNRPDKYELDPVCVSMTGHLSLIRLEVDCDCDDGLVYRTAASDLLDNCRGCSSLKPIVFKVCGVTLCNRNDSTVRFTLAVETPFEIVELDRRSSEGMSEDQIISDPVSRLEKSDHITLKAHQSARVHIAFCLTPDHLKYIKFFEGGSYAKGEGESADGAPEGVELERMIVPGTRTEERKLCFTRNFTIEFSSRTVQTLRMQASVVMPTLKLSDERVDFGQCFVGQTRELRVTLYNDTSSASHWTLKQEDATEDAVFQFSTQSGRLAPRCSLVDKNNILLSVFFKPKFAECYRASYIFEGVLGEEPVRLEVTGQGSIDGHYEAVLDV